MATFSKLQALIKTIHGDRAATIAALSEGFREDFGHFVRANNSESIVLAVGELKKSEKDTAVLTAISEGRKAAGLVEGYIGARTGKFSSQPEDVQAKFNDALDRAVQAFTDSLNASYAFTEKAKKTDAEKAKAKEDKEAKAQANKEAMVTAMVQSGEIVRASDVHKLEDASTQSLLDLLESRDSEALIDFDGHNFSQINDASRVTRELVEQLTALESEYAALKADYDALKADYATVHELAANARSLKPKPRAKPRATVPA
jgi:hypothetical protein